MFFVDKHLLDVAIARGGDDKYGRCAAISHSDGSARSYLMLSSVVTTTWNRERLWA